MAKIKEKKPKTVLQRNEIPFSKKNFVVIILGVVLIFIGFYLMIIGDVDDFIAITLAPIILFIAYVLIIPFGILKKFKNEKS
ncbi:MAG: hypothetical protein RMJ81_06205 [Candidatus Kryptonium sp.]|nr:DUF3098 domain-containing protein [Candidatus Kryptonium sp.]MDW8109227.1 hypothetical protein [Candidatus Kryptonium sp.]